MLSVADDVVGELVVAGQGTSRVQVNVIYKIEDSSSY